MTDNEKIKIIHDEPELYREFFKLSKEEKREVIDRAESASEAQCVVREIATKQPKLFV